MCDRSNHRIEVFDLDLNFVLSIGLDKTNRGDLNEPIDVKFDTAGNMYVAEWGSRRVQVMDISGHFVRSFGQEGEGKLIGPSGLHIANMYVYVSDRSRHCIFVYETSGRFVTSFGMYGDGEGQLCGPRSITSHVGYIYVCDWSNNRVQIF